MIAISNLKLAPGADEARLLHLAAGALKVPPQDITGLRIRKKSLDARRKDDIHYVYTVGVTVRGDERKLVRRCRGAAIAQDKTYPIPRIAPPQTRPVIVGFGPAGMFAALLLARAGARPIVLERGQDAAARQESFMGSFAHEMKNPMTSIIGYAELIRSQMLTPEEEQDAANYIFSEGKRLESLSFKLLDILVLKKKTAELQPCSPAQLVGGTVEHLRRVYAEKNIVLQCRCEEGMCMLEPDLVKSLLVNLLDNARKAMDGGGNIYVVSEMLPDGCRIRVLDTGRGIPQEEIAHITEAFYRVDKSRSRAQGGVGLGLSLCSEIVQLHNGTMSFASRVGNGTCVTVELKGGAV